MVTQAQVFDAFLTSIATIVVFGNVCADAEIAKADAPRAKRRAILFTMIFKEFFQFCRAAPADLT